MLVLPRFIVSPRSANIRLICERLSGDNLLAEVHDDSFRPIETRDYEKKTYVVYDVKTGVISECTQQQYDSINQFCESRFIEWCAKHVDGATGYEAYQRVQNWFYTNPNERLKWETDYRETQLREKRATTNQCRLLQALASHQVVGDDLIKGLQAAGLTVRGKIVNNYLGGWTFSYPDVESLVCDLKQREE